jgi:predicted HD superfamily hydrolase involved in NAD metabolism
MMNRDQQLKLLKKYISGSRLKHSISTEKTAVKLAKLYNEDTKKAALAGLMHDIAKELPKSKRDALIKKHHIKLDTIEELNPDIIHGRLAALILAENGVKSQKVLDAVAHHTMGAPNMSKLEKIVYLADLIEPRRSFKGVKKLRFYASKDLDVALFESMKISLGNVLKKDRPIHPQTLEAYNSLLIKHFYKKSFL